jgi:hypothetical protein
VAGGKPTMSETLPNFGAVWYINDRLNAYASYSEGYTVADVGRVLRAINRDGQRVDSLIDLSPVVSDNREIGLEYDDGRFSVTSPTTPPNPSWARCWSTIRASMPMRCSARPPAWKALKATCACGWATAASAWAMHAPTAATTPTSTVASTATWPASTSRRTG